MPPRHFAALGPPTSPRDPCADLDRYTKALGPAPHSAGEKTVCRGWRHPPERGCSRRLSQASVLGDQIIEEDKLDHARTPCGCAASPMSMILSDSSTQSSGGGTTIQGCRDTGPALSSKKRNLGKVGQLKILLRRPGIHGVTYLGSICASLYRSEVNEVFGSQLSSAPCLATADAPPPSSHHTWTANSWFRRYDRKSRYR